MYFLCTITAEQFKAEATMDVSNIVEPDMPVALLQEQDFVFPDYVLVTEVDAAFEQQHFLAQLFLRTPSPFFGSAVHYYVQFCVDVMTITAVMIAMVGWEHDIPFFLLLSLAVAVSFPPLLHQWTIRACRSVLLKKQIIDKNWDVCSSEEQQINRVHRISAQWYPLVTYTCQSHVYILIKTPECIRVLKDERSSPGSFFGG